MGGFEEIDEGILAGEKIGNADIDDAADINPVKIEKRPIYMEIPLDSGVFTGASVVTSVNDNIPVLQFPNTNSGTAIFTTSAPRGEISPGERLKVKILWKTAATTGSARLIVQIKPATTGISSLSSAVEKAIIDAAPSSAGLAKESVLEFPASIFGPSQIIGIYISRDPDNSLDTLAANVLIAAIVLEINGRC